MSRLSALRRGARARLAAVVLGCGCATGLDPVESRVDDLERRAAEMAVQVDRAARDANAAARSARSAAADARPAALRAEQATSDAQDASPAAPHPAHEAARGAESRASARLASAALAHDWRGVGWAPVTLGSLAVLDHPRRDDVLFDHYRVNPTIDTAEEPTSRFSVTVDTTSYALARSYLERGELPPEEAARVEQQVNAFDYGYATEPNAEVTVHAELAPSPTRRGFHVLDLALRARPVAERARPPAHLVFVIDVSGSMNVDDRLGFVKRTLRLLVDRLTPDDTIGIVVYDDHGHALLEPTSIARREAILATVDALAADGPTNLQEGLELGYALADRHLQPGATNRVVLCSDGVATPDGAILEQVREHATRGITVFAVGFGTRSDDDAPLGRLAHLGEASYSYVEDERDARRIVERALTGSTQVAARDFELELELDPAAVVRYRLIGYENRHLDDPQPPSDHVDAGVLRAGQAVTALYELELVNPTPRRIGTVRIRYDEPSAAGSRSIEEPPTTAELQASLERASPRLRLAATVAAFAEKLRGSYWSRAVRYDELIARIEGLGPGLGERTEVIELRRAMVLARALDRRPDRFDVDAPASTMGFEEVPVLR